MNFIIFPNQLFENINLLKSYKNIYLIEHPVFFGERDIKMNFNKKKLLLHLSSMRYYETYLKNHLKHVHYIFYHEANDFLKYIKGDFTFYNPVDYYLLDLIEKGAISEYNITNVKDDKTGNIIDYTHEMHPSDQFCDEILTLNKHNKRIEIQGGKRIVENAVLIDEDKIEEIVED